MKRSPGSETDQPEPQRITSMFTKTLLATTAAALISAGAMTLSTSGAEAGYHYQNGYYATQTISIPKQIYKTYYKTVLAGYDDCYNPIYKQVAYTAYETVYVEKYVKVFVPSYDRYSYAPSYNSSY